MHILHAASFGVLRRHQFLVSQASAEALTAFRAERDAANKKVESLQMALTSLREDQERLQVTSRLAVLDG
jgi:predicted  nucleic acid-binding Zn-ribbon protein